MLFRSLLGAVSGALAVGLNYVTFLITDMGSGSALHRFVLSSLLLCVAAASLPSVRRRHMKENGKMVNSSLILFSVVMAVTGLVLMIKGSVNWFLESLNSMSILLAIFPALVIIVVSVLYRTIKEYITKKENQKNGRE